MLHSSPHDDVQRRGAIVGRGRIGAAVTNAAAGEIRIQGSTLLMVSGVLQSCCPELGKWTSATGFRTRGQA